MDIGPIQTWAEGSAYKKHDIVKLGNLSYPDPSQEVRLANGVGSTSDLSSSSIIQAGEVFDIESSIEYTASCMIKKSESSDSLIDQNRTLIKKTPGAGGGGMAGGGGIDLNASIGVGIGLQFYDSGGGLISPDDFRFTTRLLASSELDDKEWAHAQLHVRRESIPPLATKARMVIICFGHSSGTFLFTNMESRPANRFFYSMEDHGASENPLTSYNTKWTQEFFWRPSYGGSTQFSSINENLKIGEGGDYVNNLAINSLPMSLSLQFENKTDQESRAIIHFLQEKFFAYDSIFSLDYKGERLLSSEVQSFKFNYSYPYKKDLMYTCTKFNHSIVYRNKHTISATFICNTGSTIQSTESHSGYNKKLDAILPVAIDGTVKFEKGVQKTLRTYSTEAAETIDIEAQIARTREDEIRDENLTTGSIELSPIVDRISRYPKDPNQQITGGIISFNLPYDMEVGSCVFIRIDDPENSMFNVGLATIEGRLAENKYYFLKLVDGIENEIAPPLRPIADQDRNPLESDTTDDDLISMEADEISQEEYGYSVIKMSRCPWNCLSTSPLMPDGVDSVSSTFMDDDGQESSRILFLPNYRRVQLDSEITAETQEVKLTPLEDFEISESFDLIVPAVHGRSSIYLDKPNEIQKYPYLRLRNFEQRPSQTFTIDHSPDHIQSEFTKVYNKKFKRGINQNLSTFNVTFQQRSDKEAKDILQFLESHIGYKKFRFQMPRPYLSDVEYHASLSGKSSCIFYCPSWTHVVKFKNNHTINATFIESNTFEIEDLRKVFGLGEGRTPEGPCYEAEIYNFVTKYEMCTFSSILEAAITHAEGKDYADDDPMIVAKGKQVDMVFILDTESEMFSSLKYLNDAGAEESQPKIDIVIDVLKKMATAYGIYVAPGTDDFGQPSVIDAPVMSPGVPPWPIDDTTNESLAQASFNDFYENYPNLNNYTYKFSNAYDSLQTRRFKVKIGLKEVNIGIVLVDHEKPLVTLIGGGKNQLIGEREVVDTISESRWTSPSTGVDEKILPIIREGSASYDNDTKRYSFTMDLVDNNMTRLAEVVVDKKGGALVDIISNAVKQLVNSYSEENDSWFTFTLAAITGRFGYYTWKGDMVPFTNQVTSETKQVKKLVRVTEGGEIPKDIDKSVWVILFDEKGNRVNQGERVVVGKTGGSFDLTTGEVTLGDDVFDVTNTSRMVRAWVEPNTGDTVRGYTGNRTGDYLAGEEWRNASRSDLTTGQKENLATQARAYCLYYAEQDEIFPQPEEIITTREEVRLEPIWSATNENDYFDKVIIYNKLDALSLEKKTEINYLNAAREALYQLFFSTRAETVTDRFIFMIGRGNPGKSAINLLNEVRENRDLALRRPNDYDLFREKVISEERPPVRYDGRAAMPWYEEHLQTRVIFAGTMGVTDGPNESAKKYAYDYYNNPSNPHGHLEVASDKLGRVGELGAFMDIFKTIEILCTDTGYQNMLKVTIHNCGPHSVKLLNTLVSSHDEEDPIRYTTELLASGIPKGGFSNDIQTIQAGEDLSVAMGTEDESRLTDDEDPVSGSVNVISADAEEDDPVSMIIGALDNSFIPGEGGQFFGDPNNTNLLDSRNDRQNVKWESFNTRYEVYRAGRLESVDGGWESHKQESKGVYNEGVAFKNMPVRMFRLQSGLEILDYNIGNVSNENEKRGTYEHIPEIKPGEEIDLFFGVRSATYDINDRATNGFEDIQLVFNAEDKTMNKMDFYANVTFRVFGQNIQFDFQNEQLDMFFPYEMQTPEEKEEEEEEEEDPVISPVEGIWEFSGSTLYSGMRMSVDLGPAITTAQSDGEPLSNNDGQIVGTAKFRSNIDFDQFDNGKLWHTIKDNEHISEVQADGSSVVVASLPAGKATQYASYSAPTMSPIMGSSMDTQWDGNYLLRDNELIIFSNSAGTGQTTMAGTFVKKNLEYQGENVTYEAIDGTVQAIEDPRTTTFQYKFVFSDPLDRESKSGSGNDWQKALTAGGHGEYYLAENTWADPRLTGGAPSKPEITDPEASASWIGNGSKSRVAKIARV